MKVINSVLIVLLAFFVVPCHAAYEMIYAVPGSRWEYECYKTISGVIHIQGRTMATLDDASFGSSVYEVLAPEEGKPNVFNYKETTKLRSVKGNEESSEVSIKFIADGIKILSTVVESSSDKQPDEQVYDPPLNYYIKDPAQGKSWDVGEMRDEKTKTYMKARIAGKETVTVPAGTFKDCLRVVYSSDNVSGTIELWQKDFNITEGHSRGIYWIADGVGVVKELEISFTKAQAEGPNGVPIILEGSSCSLSELKPGYKIK